MRRTRSISKTAAVNYTINSESEVSDENEVEQEQKKTPQRRQTRIASQRYRMKNENDEEFVRMCVENFDEINSTVTLKGIFTHKKTIAIKVWENITAKCNTDFNVSRSIKILFLNLDYSSHFCHSLDSIDSFFSKVKIVYIFFQFIQNIEYKSASYYAKYPMVLFILYFFL